MTSGRKNIDYGPVALAVGEISDAKASVPKHDQVASDAARLLSILARAELPVNTHMESIEKPILEQETDSRQFGDPSPYELAQELERLWVCNGAGGQREVRLRLAPEVIPGTWVRILNHSGELCIVLSAASDRTIQWLGQVSQNLAKDLAMRLHCAVRIVIDDAASKESAVHTFEWKGADHS